jgi:hypothetical protein
MTIGSLLLRQVVPPALFCLIFFAGCISSTTLQTPETLAPGKVSINLGNAIPQNGKDGTIEFGGRVGILTDFDAGIKFVPSFPSISSDQSLTSPLLFIDGKVQFTRQPLAVAFDLGYSHSGFHTSDGSVTCNAWYPLVLVGQQHWYTGIKGVIANYTGEANLFHTTIRANGTSWIATGWVLGGSIGTKLRILPEIDTYFTGHGKPYLVPCFGIQYTP